MGPAETPVTTVPLVGSLAAALVAVLIGQWLGRLLADAPVTVPDFLLSLLAGLVLRDGDGDRQHAGARAPPRSGAAGLSHHPDRRRLLHRHHQCGRADAVPVARHDGVRVTEGFQLVAG